MRTIAAFLCFALLVNADGLPTSTPEQAGFAKDRLARIDTVMQQHAAKGDFAGASGLIVRKGKVAYYGQWGDMKRDSILRMYSMTKAVTGVAAMILYEEGKFFLSDPISKYLPEFKDMRVAVDRTENGKRIFYTVPAERPITVLDLFRHTSGLDYTGPKDESGKLYYQKLELTPGPAGSPLTTEEFVKRLATAPLMDQPGTVFRYGVNTDVLGRLVEVISGKTLEQFFEERIFKPLGMKDTAFYVPEEKFSRFATLYAKPANGALTKMNAPAQEAYKKRTALFLGGAGLVSTIDDYARFCAMLLNNGELNGTRILSRKSVELMRSNHLGAMGKIGPTLQDGHGFGLTFAVNLGPGKYSEIGSEGEYYWGGAAGTRFFIDPKEQMFGVFFVNQFGEGNQSFGAEFRRLAYQAIVD
jgi:CubicO group peptidase (beta-lactamase class C family)